uniref:AAA-like domain-containing protein n=1 Tax=Sphaerothrix gracilis TaxID=3151835 RepID=UPI0031FDDF9B
MADLAFFTTGGTVQAGGGVYLSRRADEELLQLCQEGQFGYVLTPRQMGKSSLMVQTAERLQQQGIQTVIIDLTKIGTEVTAESWYLGLLTEIEDQLMLDTDVYGWWQQHEHLGVTQRLTRFVQGVLLAEVTQQIVIFVDEIDTTLSLSFTDDFFVAIRYFYTARAQNPELKRLSFVLIGVATPGDLIRDPQRTPFNVGQRVDLTDFSLEEALPFATGLAVTNADQVLGWVLDWTHGHPYLTQRLCQTFVEQRPDGAVAQSDIDGLVESTFLSATSQRQDNNLQFVRDMLTQRAPDTYEVLSVYRQVWRGRQPVLDEEQSIIKSHLKLSGAVRREAATGTLQVRNPIYRAVFDEGWVKEHLPVNWMKRLQRARAALAVMATVLFVAVPFGVVAEVRRREAEALRLTAQEQTILAQANASKGFLLDDQSLEALVAATNAVQLAKQENLQDSVTATPAIAALRQAVYHYKAFNLEQSYGFRERQQLKDSGGSV